MAGNLNRALLIGVVARPAEVDAAGWRMTVAIPTEGDGGLHVERVDVAGDARLSAVVGELQSAQLVYVEGRLARGEDRRAVVRAASVMALADPPPPPEPSGPGEGTHASPRAHERAGHARVLHRGTDRETVVWVRSTSVGGPAARRSTPGAATLPGDAGAATPG